MCRRSCASTSSGSLYAEVEELCWVTHVRIELACLWLANGDPMTEAPIPFSAFTNFERLTPQEPLLQVDPPHWAAASHAIIIDNTVHYLWAEKRDRDWVLMHNWAPTSDPTEVTTDPRNPILKPQHPFENKGVEYPYPFYNPADGRFYMFYLCSQGGELPTRKQTGLLVADDDLSTWTRVGDTPVVCVGGAHEEHGCSHPSVTLVADVIHMVYTGEAPAPPEREKMLYNVPTICHATAPTSDPTQVTKDLANPIFTGSGLDWDRHGVREAEILKGPVYFHIFYGGYDGQVWAIGHVRTRDFRTFEPNPSNPIFTPSRDPKAWDSSGLLTPQVFQMNGGYYMIYAGLKGCAWNDVSEVQTGLAVARG